MSLQHFYSRVPARVSIFNKRDGFDTFAHSSGLDRDFILGPLSQVYNDRLKYLDHIKVRRGEMPVVYSQALLLGGESVQTAVSYMPLDFTGERSAYLAHSLILTEQEKAALFSCRDALTFNSEMFVTDISSFNITSPTAIRNTSLEECQYRTRRFTDFASVIRRYNPEMVKSLLYSLLSAVCSGGLDVYFHLPYPDFALSGEALNFINAILSVLPYSLRSRVSFVTFVTDVDSHPGFKLKCTASYCDRIYPHRGVFYDFATGVVSGQPADYGRNVSLVNFLYSLYDNKNVRDAFHAYVDGIEKAYEGFVIDVRNLSEMVFTFWQCSGYYVEQSVLPSDIAVSSFFRMYGSYRAGISTEYRVKAYRCLERYATEHRVIPKDIFAMLWNLYPDEYVSAKAVALDILLKLIHLPAMREDLFDFISKNYSTEIDRVKLVINANLARVFYGGFLQHRILSFFDRNFASEPEAATDLIIDKLLLTIRTPQIQREIVAFLDRHYLRLTATQKTKLYNTCLEMIPECDNLSVMLINIVNRHINRADSETKNYVKENLTKILSESLARGENNLAAMLIDSNGFCEEIATSYIWESRIGGEVFIDTLAAMGVCKRATKLIRMYKTLPELTDEDYEALLSTFTETTVSVLPSTLYEILQIDKAVDNYLPENQARHFRNTIIYPTIPYTFLDVFKVKYGKDGIDMLLKYTHGKPSLTNTPQYLVLQNYLTMVDAAKRGDTEEAFRQVMAMPNNKIVRQDIADFVRMCALDTANQDENTTFIFELIIGYLKTENFRFDTLYTKYRKIYQDINEDRTGLKAKVDPADRRGAADAMELLLSAIEGLYVANDEFERLIVSSACGLERAIGEFVQIYGIGAWMFIKQHSAGCPDEIMEMAKSASKEQYTSVQSVSDAVDLVLRKNK